MKMWTPALSLAFALAACSSNPDPEYAPDADDAPAAVAPVEAAPPADAAAAPQAAAPQAADATTLSEERTMELGREVAQLLFDGDMETLWPRFDDAVHAQAGSAENFGAMIAQVFGQIGAEMNVVEEEVLYPEAQPGLSVYRRRGHYLAMGANADLYVAFNADESIGGINIRPVQE